MYQIGPSEINYIYTRVDTEKMEKLKKINFQNVMQYRTEIIVILKNC